MTVGKLSFKKMRLGYISVRNIVYSTLKCEHVTPAVTDLQGDSYDLGVCVLNDT